MSAFKILRISGSPYESGHALGRFGIDPVLGHLRHTRTWNEVLQWRGTPTAATMANLVQQRFPRVWSELQGLAAGLNLPFEDVFLWNCRGDLLSSERHRHAADGCTTVQIPGPNSHRILHNEDGDPNLAGHCALAHCSVTGGAAFTAFVYPGSLPGHAFAVTEFELAVTVNNLRMLSVEAGVPRMVLTRALLECSGPSEVLKLLRQEPRSGGFHLSLTHPGDDLLSVEFSHDLCSVQVVTEPSIHTNHGIHEVFRDLPQMISESSGYRQLRGNALLTQARARGIQVDPRAILADESNAMYPILRQSPADPEGEVTLATADMNINAAGVRWQVLESSLRPACLQFRNDELI